jgi:hypothetical protein
MVLGAAGLAAFWVTAALTQPATKARQPARAPAKAAGPANNASAYRAQSFTPGFDDLMTMLIQPRHAKLYYAGTAKNWELAAGESRDLRQSLDRLAQTLPNYEGNDVRQAVSNFITKKLDAVDAAVASADAARFTGAYKDLTTGCNDCHTYMEHPFLVIKVPEAAANTVYPDQDFKPETN